MNENGNYPGASSYDISGFTLLSDTEHFNFSSLTLSYFFPNNPFSNTSENAGLVHYNNGMYLNPEFWGNQDYNFNNILPNYLSGNPLGFSSKPDFWGNQGNYLNFINESTRTAIFISSFELEISNHNNPIISKGKFPDSGYEYSIDIFKSKYEKLNIGIVIDNGTDYMPTFEQTVIYAYQKNGEYFISEPYIEKDHTEGLGLIMPEKAIENEIKNIWSKDKFIREESLYPHNTKPLIGINLPLNVIIADLTSVCVILTLNETGESVKHIFNFDSKILK